MATLEQRAQQIIKQHLSISTPSYGEVKSRGFTGFMEGYLQFTKNNQIMSTSANFTVMLELASIDKFRDHKLYYTIFNSLLKL